jgi:hypothetical protein
MGERDEIEERRAARMFSYLSPTGERDQIESSLSPVAGERAG